MNTDQRGLTNRGDEPGRGEHVPSEDGIPHLAERLNALFDRVPDPNGQPYSNVTAARELTEKGYPVSHSYLGQLRAGKKDNPTARLLNGIATELFGVKMSYFLGDDDEAILVQKQLDLLALIRDTRVQGMATRLAGMSDSAVASVDTLINHLRQIEGLDRAEDEGQQPDS